MRAVGIYITPRNYFQMILLNDTSLVDIKNGAGPADSLFINENVDTPTPGKGDILVRVKVDICISPSTLLQN